MGDLAPPPCATARAAPVHPAGAPLRRADSCLQALGNLPARLAHRVVQMCFASDSRAPRWPCPLHWIWLNSLARSSFLLLRRLSVETGRRSAPPVGAWPRCTLGRPRAQKKKAAHRESRWKGVGVARCAGLLLAVIRSVRLRLFGARAEASAGEETEAPSVPGPQPKWRRFRLIPSQRPPPR